MDSFYSIVGILNLHSSMFVLFLSLLMLACINKEYKYIKNLKNGRRQLFIALVGIFIITGLHSLNFILNFYFSEFAKPFLIISGLVFDILSIGVLGNFLATKWKIALNSYVEEEISKKESNEKSKSKR